MTADATPRLDYALDFDRDAPQVPIHKRIARLKLAGDYTSYARRDVNARDIEGNTPLSLAAFYADAKCVSLNNR